MARADGAPENLIEVDRLRKLLADDLITPRKFTIAIERLLDAISFPTA